jgi:hypothetical protein
MLVALSTVGVLLMAYGFWHRPPAADDFGPFYRAASLAGEGGDVYSQPSVSPGRNTEGMFLPYIRFPFYAEILRPFALLPYQIARGIWIAAVFPALAACVWLFRGRRTHLVAALACSFPLMFTLIAGQDICFVVLIVLAAASIYAGGREFLAGIAASLLGIKPTYLPAAALVFLARSRRATLGLITGTAVELAVSFAVGGRGWPAEYAELLRSPLLDVEPGRMLNVRAIMSCLQLPAVAYVIAGVALYAGFWLTARKLRVPDALMAGLAVSVIASPHCKVYDGVALIPLFVEAATLRTWTGRLALFALTPFPYLFSLMGDSRLQLAGSSVVVLAALASALCLYRARPRAAMEAPVTVAQAG